MATDPRSIHQVSNRRRLVRGLVLALTAASLAIPAAAAARPVGVAHVEGSDQAGQATAAVPDQGTVTLHRDGSKAVPFVAEPSGTSTAGAFDWGDAMIGAGGAVALIALIGAGGFTLRVRQRMTPATPSQG